MNQPVQAPHTAYPAMSAPTQDLPLVAVQRLGVRTARDGMYIGLILALLGHTFAVTSPDYTMWMTRLVVGKMNRELKAYYNRTQDVEVVDETKKKAEDEKAEEEPEPVQEPDPEPVQEPDPQAQPVPVPQPDATDEPYPDEPYQAPAAAAAAAQDTLTTTPEDGIDLTQGGWSIVDNDGSTSRSTGYSSNNGKGQGNIRDPRARADGVNNGTGNGPPKPRPAPAPPMKDMSRQAAPVAKGWSCPFPAQADLNQVDNAVATISVTVGPNGRAQRASVISDPGYGFGAQAKRCAMSSQYSPALDKRGNKITQTVPVRVRFSR